MSQKINDNRMSWIRLEEKLLTKRKSSYEYEYEIASEQRITGSFNYKKGFIQAGLFVLEKNDQGLYKYLLKVKYASYEAYNENANKKGYYFKDGVLGELLSLLSLHFRCRFYLISITSGQLTPKELKLKTENGFLYKKTNPDIHPQVLVESTNKNWVLSKTSDFLEMVKKLDPIYHQKFILACYHYHLALREIGINTEMVFIRLVSAIETLSETMILDKKEDVLQDTNIGKLLDNSSLDSVSKNELAEIFNVRKSSKKFVRFIENYCKGYFKGGNFKAKHCKIQKANLSTILNGIYTARSEYLHKGEPMYLSMHMRGEYKWDMDPGMGMIIDNRSIPASKKLPYAYFFEGLVRQCLINFLNDKIVQQVRP